MVYADRTSATVVNFLAGLSPLTDGGPFQIEMVKPALLVIWYDEDIHSFVERVQS